MPLRRRRGPRRDEPAPPPGHPPLRADERRRPPRAGDLEPPGQAGHRGPPGRLCRRAAEDADLPAGRPGGEPGGARAAGPGPGAGRRGAAVLRELGRGLPGQDRHRQGRPGRRAAQPDDGTRPRAGHDRPGPAEAGHRGRRTVAQGLRLESDLKVGTYLPMIYHVGDQPFTYSVFLCGGTLVLGRRPTPKHIAEMIDAERVTALWGGSPAMVRALDAVLTARPDLDARSLTVIVYGWAALPPATLASMKRHCGEDLCAFEIFGQTESISCHRFWPGEWPELYAATAPQQNYVGVPSPILASTVFDPDGRDLADQPGVAGEAVYRSPAVMAGYYRDEEATRYAFRYGWFHSGDSCAYDDAGLRPATTAT